MLNAFLKTNFDKLNTSTKYPSILTYHSLGEKGRLQEELSFPVTEESQDNLVQFTEKVDGTNSRIIICGDDYVIGSREELLYAKGDRVINPSLGIVKTLIPIAEKITNELSLTNGSFAVVYGETYGGNIGHNKKNYTESGEFGYRMFDMWKMSTNEIVYLFETKSLSKISSWRENSGQPFVSVGSLNRFSQWFDLHKTPAVFECKRKDMLTDVQGMYEFLTQYTDTLVGLDVTGKSEGLVVRDANRKFISKIRFEDYERTLGIKKKK